MIRSGKTKSLSESFKNSLIDCYTVIVKPSGHTVLHEAITLNRREVFKLCEIYGADWNQADINGVTPLMKSAALNNMFFVEKLI